MAYIKSGSKDGIFTFQFSLIDRARDKHQSPPKDAFYSIRFKVSNQRDLVHGLAPIEGELSVARSYSLPLSPSLSCSHRVT
ncbi:hypothetical protein C0J52_01449 [Blattella germanica]|nr:hypothetical protein C0J52_01449 [Blattella germanica]